MGLIGMASGSVLFRPVLGALALVGSASLGLVGWLRVFVWVQPILAFFILGESQIGVRSSAAFAEIRADDARLETPTTWSLDQRFLFSHFRFTRF